MRTVILPLRGILHNGFSKPGNLTTIARKQGLYFLNHEKIGAHVVAVDTMKRKLLFAKTNAGSASFLIIDLNNLESCRIIKAYKNIEAGVLQNSSLHHFLESVFLKLVFKNGSGDIMLSLYNAQKEALKNIALLELQAKRLQSIISKTLPLRIGERA